MRVQSIRTAIEPRNPARNRFLGPSVQMTMGKMDCVAELDHIAQEVGTMAEALQDAGNLLPARLGTPLVIDSGHFASGIAIFDQLDFGLVAGFSHAFFLQGIPHYITTISRTHQPRDRSGISENQTPVVLLESDPLAIKILKKGNCMFAGEAGQLLEARDIHQTSAKWSKPGGESA
jgi:hypothetical protein